jgi:hypothetical protein
VFLFPPCHGVSHHESLTAFCFSYFFFQAPRNLGLVQWAKRAGNTNKGEGVKDKKARTTSDYAVGNV